MPVEVLPIISDEMIDALSVAFPNRCPDLSTNLGWCIRKIK